MLPAQELACNHRIGRVDQLAVVEQTRREAGMEVEFMKPRQRSYVLLDFVRLKEHCENTTVVSNNVRLVRQT